MRMELKVGDKIVLKKELTEKERIIDTLFFYPEMKYLLGGTFELITKPISCYKIYSEISGLWYISSQWIDWEETSKLNKIKMVIGDKICVNGYKIGSFNNSNNKELRCYDAFYIKDPEGNCIHGIELHKHNYKQQMEITNLILDKLGLNVELVEGCDSNSEVLEQIGKLEAELYKLKGMVK